VNKRELIEAIRADRATLQSLWTGATEEQLCRRPGPQSDWSMKDLIAHITHWEQNILATLSAAFRGHLVEQGDTDQINARVFIENRDRPLTDIQADFQRSQDEVLTYIESLTEQQLSDTTHLWDDTPVITYIIWDTVEHYHDHLADVRAWAEREGLREW
jgi:hypothetical protein